MRFFVFACFVLIGLVATAAPTKIDINDDKILEEIAVVQTTAGNNVWQDVTIKQKNKVIFSQKKICVGIDAYEIGNIDTRTKAQEIIYWHRRRGEGNHFGKALYEAIISHWDAKTKTYIAYCHYQSLIEVETGDFPTLRKQLAVDFPVYLIGVEKTIRLLQLVAKSQWDEAAKLLDADPETHPVTVKDLKRIQKDCAKFPPDSAWQINSSPHERGYFFLTIPFAKNNDYTIVINERGINKIAQGYFD